MSSHHDQIEKFAKKAEAWDYKLDRLQHRIKDLPDEVKTKAGAVFEELKTYRGELDNAKQKLTESSEKAFDEAEATLDKLWGKTKALFKDAEETLED